MTFAGPSAAPGDLCKPHSPKHLEATDRAGRLHRARPTPRQKTLKPQAILSAIAEPKVGGALREPWTTFHRHIRPGNSDSAYFPFDSGLLSARVAAIKGGQVFSCGNRHKALGGRAGSSVSVWCRTPRPGRCVMPMARSLHQSLYGALTPPVFKQGIKFPGARD